MPSSPWPFLAGEAELGAQTCPDPPDPGSAARAVPRPPSPPWACPAPRVCGIHRKAQQAGEGQRAALPGLLLRERRAGRDKNISGKSESPWRSVGWERWERCPGESSDSSSLSRHSRAASALPGQGGSQGRLFLCGVSRAAANSRPPGPLPPSSRCCWPSFIPCRKRASASPLSPCTAWTFSWGRKCQFGTPHPIPAVPAPEDGSGEGLGGPKKGLPPSGRGRELCHPWGLARPHCPYPWARRHILCVRTQPGLSPHCWDRRLLLHVSGTGPTQGTLSDLHHKPPVTFPIASQVFPQRSHPREWRQTLSWEVSLFMLYLHSTGTRLCWWEGEGQ